MAVLSDRFLEITKRLVDKYGGTITISRKSGGTFNPVTQKESSVVTSFDTLKAVIEDYKQDEINEVVRYGDKKFIIDKIDLINLTEPQTDDIVSFGGDTYRVIFVEGISGGDKFVGYKLQARK